MKRREFLRTSTGGAVAFPYVAASTVLGANDRVTVGFIGVGRRARWLLQHSDFGEARIAAVADIYDGSLQETAKIQPANQRWNSYHDYRRMFEKEKLDGVFVETTTHARVLICIHAIQAGLDVYAEKPMSLTVEEGRVLTRFARRHQRVVQIGTQQRSMPINIYASKLVSSGKIGKIKEVIACNFISPEGWTPHMAYPAPAGLDWDQWCNQTELRPYHPQLHRRWGQWWAYDGGGLSWGVTGWGAHALDQVQAALGTDHTGPVEIWLGKSEAPGLRRTVTARYASGTLLKLEQEIIRDHQQLGAIFVGTEGRIQILRGDFTADPPELKKGAPPITKEGPGEMRFHLRNFFDCIRSRKRPNADVEIGHRSSTLCHLVNICRTVGRRLKWDPRAEKFLGDEEANWMLSRARRKGYELPPLT